VNRIQQLHELGQSVWLDSISRGVLGPDGELAAQVAAGIRGVTSNPTIFEKAVGGSDAYDAQIAEIIAAAGSGKAPAAESVFEDLAVTDIRAACDVLRGVYDEAGGTDGFVSIEVAPDLAFDTEGTMVAARRLWSRVDRRNVMVKVPATDEGVPAVEQLTAEGLNINITLMFALADYEAVANAFITGLERCEDPSQVSSVASFFVSRVDTKADAALDKIGTEAALSLRGRSAVANAKLAYRRYQELFEGERFSRLAAAGARPQRVLWASTSTKNPAYPDTMYVDQLIGPNTINTMPPATVDAFNDHGTVAPTLTEGLEDAEAVIAGLGEVGVSYDQVTKELQTEGVQAFADSMAEVYTTIRAKMAELES
jgi:transaldolase